MTDRKKVYWDACAWLGLLNGESDKAQELEVVWEKAKHGEVEIWTSAFCIAALEDGRALCVSLTDAAQDWFPISELERNNPRPMKAFS